MHSFCRNFGSMTDRVCFPMNSASITDNQFLRKATITHSFPISFNNIAKDTTFIPKYKLLPRYLNSARFWKFHHNFYIILLDLNFLHVGAFLTSLVPFDFDKCSSSYWGFIPACPITGQNYTTKSKNLPKIEIYLDSYKFYVVLKLIESMFISNKFHFIYLRRTQVVGSRN